MKDPQAVQAIREHVASGWTPPYCCQMPHCQVWRSTAALFVQHMRQQHGIEIHVRDIEELERRAAAGEDGTRKSKTGLAYDDLAVYTVGIVGKQGKLTNGNEALVSDRIAPFEEAYGDTETPLGDGGSYEVDVMPILRQRGLLPEAAAFITRHQWEDLPPPTEQFVKQKNRKGAPKL